MTSFARKIKFIFELILEIIFSVMLLASLLNVATRYFPFSINGLNEVAILCFIYVSFFGAALAAKEHLQVDVFYRLLPNRWNKYLNLLTSILSIIALLIMLTALMQLCILNFHADTSGYFQYPKVIRYIPAIIFVLIMLATFFHKLAETFKKT